MTEFRNELTRKNSAGLRIAIAALTLACFLSFLAVMVGIGLYWNQASQAQPPEPGATMPTILLEPASGPSNTVVTVQGQNWPVESMVLIYTAAPDESLLPDFAVTNATVDDDGRFVAIFTLPADPRWEQAGLVRVIARTQTGEITTHAFFELTGEPATATLPPLTTPTDSASNPTPTTDSASSPTPPTDTVPGFTPTPTAQPQPLPSPQPVEARATATADVNVRGGPGTNYPVLGILRSGQSARVTGIAPDGNWWQIEFSGVVNGRGWVAAQFVTAQQVANIPIVQPPVLPATATPLPPTPPPPTATPPPPVITEWRGEYFDNPQLGGPPVLVRNDPAVRFGWGPNSPGPGVPADNFSARWTRDIHFSAGTYRFKVLVDDGARLWVNDQLIIDRWRTGPPESFYGEISLSEGTHRVRLEYFEHIYDAQVHLEWERIRESEGSLPDFPEWRAEYFDNRNLEGVPVLVRNESRIAHNWGTGSPGPQVPADNFSARWLRQVEIPSGTYGMRVTVDDGVRVWIGDVLFIDNWQSGEARTIENEGYLGAGRHWLRVEYFERTGQALINVEWFRKG